MTDKKIILEELGRIRELMGFNDNSTLNINEAVGPGGPGKGIFDEVIPGGAKTLDNLGALGKTYDDLFTYSSRMSNLVPSKNIDDFIDLVGRQNNTTKNLVTKDMLKAFIANDSLLTKELMESAAKIAEERVALLLSKISFNEVFTRAGYPNVPSKLNDGLKTPVDDTNINILNQVLDLTENIIKGEPTLKNSLEGKELLEQIAGKRQQIKDFEDLKIIKNQNISPSPLPSPNSISDGTIDELTERLRQQIQSSFDTNNTTSVQSQLNDIIIDLESKNLLNIPEGMNRSTVIDQITKGSGIDERKIADVLNNLGPAEQSLYVQKQVEILTTALNRAKDNVNNSNKPSWFKKFFTKSVDETIETSNTFAKMSKIKPVATVKGITKGYLIIGGILSLSCFISEAWQSEKTDTLPESEDLMSCLLTVLTWLPKAGSMGWDWLTTTTYENTPEDFKKWVEDNEYTEPDYVEGDGYSYRDKNGDRQSAIYDNEEKTFKQE